MVQGINLSRKDYFDDKMNDMDTKINAVNNMYDKMIEVESEQISISSQLVQTNQQLEQKAQDLEQQIEQTEQQLAQKASKSEVNALALNKADKTYVNQTVQAANLAYKESYPTLSELQSVHPTGDIYNHVVLADGMIYTWANNAWVNTQILANGMNIPQRFITVDKLADTVTGKNRFDLSGVIDGQQINTTNGAIYSATGYTTSGFVPVASGIQLYYALLNSNLTEYTYPVGASSRIAFYDANMSFISITSMEGIGHTVSTNSETAKITIPSNVSFMRVSVNMPLSTLQTRNPIIGLVSDYPTRQSLLNNYEPYSIKISEDVVEGLKFVKEKVKQLENTVVDVEIGEGEITLNKLADAVIGDNLVNMSKVSLNKSISQDTGAIYDASGWIVSDFISVSPNTIYSAYFQLISTGAYGSYYKICYYNASKVFISGYNNGSTQSDIGTRVVTTPSNCTYVRIAIADGYSNGSYTRKMMFVEGTKLLPYEDYTLKLPVSAIKGLNSIEAKMDWENKKWMTWGDSITAIGNGNSLTIGWQKYVNEYHKFANHYGRGIGGQSFVWNKKPWFANSDGTLHSRDDNGDMTNPSSYTIPSGTTAHYGAFCSWDRITTMIPSSIKDSIDLIYVMGGTNDTASETAPTFIANDTTDLAWSQSSYYSTYNGDFNITALKGGVASAVMKLQAWCPNAVIVIGTPLSGRGSTGMINTNLTTDETTKAKQVKEVANLLSVPVIDVNTTTGINSLNRTTYITDSVHPYNTDGHKALARAVIAGLKNVIPKL